MKIVEFSVLRYGPLTLPGPVRPGNFTLFWGENEKGKTLLLEALLKMLMGQKAARTIPGVERVEEMPEGYVVVQIAGQEKKFRGKRGLLHELQITPAEFRNVFVVRDSDLQVRGDRNQPEAAVYESLTERLLGMRSQEIRHLKRKLRELGHLTDTGKFQDRGDVKIRSRMRTAHELLRGKIPDLENELKEKELFHAEETLVRLRAEGEEIQRELQLLEQARERERYEKASARLHRLRHLEEKLQEMAPYTPQALEAWLEARRTLKVATTARDRLEKELQGIQEQIKALEAQREELLPRLEKFQKDVELFRDRVYPELERLRREEEALQEASHKASFFQRTGIIAAVLAALALLGWLVHPSPWVVVFALISGGMSLFAAGNLWRHTRRRARFQRERFSLIQQVQEQGHAARSLQELRKLRKDLEDRLETERTRRIRMEESHRSLLERQQQLEADLQEKEKQIQNAEETIDRLRRQTGVSDPEELEQKLREKEAMEREIQGHREALEVLLEGPEDSWEASLKVLSVHREAAPDYAYDPKREQELQKRLRQINAEMDELTRKLAGVEERLRTVEQDAAFVLGEPVVCRTPEQLIRMKKRVEEFYSFHMKRKERVEIALAILEEMEREETRRIADLFGENSVIARHFSRITGGLYRSVDFDPERKHLVVVRRDGRMLDPGRLSGGAFDQLYFAIRIGFGERLLGEPGFFLLDDPFIKADPRRLERLLGMLQELARRGNQVLYFSAKGEVRHLLEPKIQTGEVHLVEMRGLLA